MNYNATINETRALVEALDDTGNEGAARIVERAADLIDQLADAVLALEARVAELEGVIFP